MIAAVQAAVDAGDGTTGSGTPSDQVRYLERQGSSPAARRMLQLALTYIQRGDEAHRAGKRAVYGGGMVDAPLLHAYDAFPCAFN